MNMFQFEHRPASLEDDFCWEFGMEFIVRLNFFSVGIFDMKQK